MIQWHAPDKIKISGTFSRGVAVRLPTPFLLPNPLNDVAQREAHRVCDAEVEVSIPAILPIGVPGEHTYYSYVQGKGLLSCQCDIVACPHHDHAARSYRTRCTDRNPLLRYLPLRSPSGPERVERRHAHCLSLCAGP